MLYFIIFITLTHVAIYLYVIFYLDPVVICAQDSWKRYYYKKKEELPLFWGYKGEAKDPLPLYFFTKKIYLCSSNFLSLAEDKQLFLLTKKQSLLRKVFWSVSFIKIPLIIFLKYFCLKIKAPYIIDFFQDKNDEATP